MKAHSFHCRPSLPVGVTGLEPATPCTPCKCATGLRYTPNAPFPQHWTTLSWSFSRSGCVSTERAANVIQEKERWTAGSVIGSGWTVALLCGGTRKYSCPVGRITFQHGNGRIQLQKDRTMEHPAVSMITVTTVRTPTRSWIVTWPSGTTWRAPYIWRSFHRPECPLAPSRHTLYLCSLFPLVPPDLEPVPRAGNKRIVPTMSWTITATPARTKR